MEKDSEKYLSLMKPYENAVHDIKLPMSAMYNYIQLLEANTQLDDKSREYVEVIKNNWFKAMKLINDANETVKLYRGVYAPKFGNYNIFDIAEEIFNQTKPFSEQKKIKFELNSQFREKVISLDRGMFERVLINIIINSIKFTDEGGYISIEMSAKDKNIVIAVEDDGKGIHESYLTDRYKTTNSTMGSGIGMSIIMEFTQLLGGSIDFIKLDRGSRVLLKLPDRQNAESETVYKKNRVMDSLFQTLEYRELN